MKNNLISIYRSLAPTTTTTTTSTTTTAVYPAQCFSYTTNQDSTRLANATAGSSCDTALFSLYFTWTRFLGLAGTDLATSAPSINRCGTSYPGWYIDALPAAGHTVVGTVCYAWITSSCLYNNLISVTNCGTFYVYGLVDPPVCNSRYCTV